MYTSAAAAVAAGAPLSSYTPAEKVEVDPVLVKQITAEPKPFHNPLPKDNPPEPQRIPAQDLVGKYIF